MEQSKLSPEVNHDPHFKEFILQLADKFEPFHIFRFSQNIFSQNYQDGFNDDQGNFTCNYCLLVVTATEARIDYQVQDFANTHYQHGTITIICHGRQSVLDAINANSRFFKTVFTSGELLYSHDGIQVKPFVQPYNPIKADFKAAKHYQHRMPLAEGFLLCASQCLEKKHYGICAFMLHQVVEQTCICLIRVHVAYRSEFHNLRRLLGLCNCFSQEPSRLFLSTHERERLFTLMSKSYSGARYKDGFLIKPQEAADLYQLVCSFTELANKMCTQKIEQLTSQAFAYNLETAGNGLSPTLIIN